MVRGAESGRKMTIPIAAKKIIDELEDHGYEAYIVGGCVRDMLLFREPGDWDITTSARPEDVKRIFRRTVDTGIEHGTVTVLMRGGSYEVTTFRVDGKYEDHRHPSEVVFTPSLEEDLKRRDFTINAMAYSDTKGIIDLYGGQEDLKAGIIRCVGDPMQRFGEDALRMLRGIRFAGQLLFDIEEETFAAIKELAPTLINVSAERIQVELTKLLLSGGASDRPADGSEEISNSRQSGSDRLRLAYETGLSKYFLPELDEMMKCEQHNPHHCYTVGEHTLRVIAEVNRLISENNNANNNEEKTDINSGKKQETGAFIIDKKQHIALVYAALLHDIAKPVCITTDEKGIDHFHGHDVQGEEMAGQILHRLKFDNDTIATVKALVRNHDVRYKNSVRVADEPDSSEVASAVSGQGMVADEPDSGGEIIGAGLVYAPGGKRQIRRLMNRIGRERMPLLFLLQRADILAQSEYKKDEKLAVLAAGERCYREVCEASDAVTIKELAITGNDLINEKGFEPGPAIGIELKRLLELVMDDPELNTRERLLAEVSMPD